MNHSEIVSFLWGVADLIRDSFKRSKSQDVILPLTVPPRRRTRFEHRVESAAHVPDAWIDTSRRDAKDGQVGIVGYEIHFNRYFYKYVPPRPLAAIEADIRAIEKDIVRMLAEITGSTPREVVE